MSKSFASVRRWTGERMRRQRRGASQIWEPFWMPSVPQPLLKGRASPPSRCLFISFKPTSRNPIEGTDRQLLKVIVVISVCITSATFNVIAHVTHIIPQGIQSTSSSVVQVTALGQPQLLEQVARCQLAMRRLFRHFHPSPTGIVTRATFDQVSSVASEAR